MVILNEGCQEKRKSELNPFRIGCLSVCDKQDWIQTAWVLSERELKRKGNTQYKRGTLRRFGYTDRMNKVSHNTNMRKAERNEQGKTMIGQS